MDGYFADYFWNLIFTKQYWNNQLQLVSGISKFNPEILALPVNFIRAPNYCPGEESTAGSIFEMAPNFIKWSLVVLHDFYGTKLDNLMFTNLDLTN